MHRLALAILTIGTLSAAGPVTAQTYDPSYPVCLRIYGEITYNDCRYTSLPQCVLSASGRAGQCLVNPYFASAHEGPKHAKRYREVY
jgi:Protein of unknown function (DUF3551)